MAGASTQLRDYYDALCALKEEEQTALAEFHASDPELLAHRFAHSLKAVESLEPIDESFYPAGARKPVPDVPPDEIRTTFDFVSRLDGRTWVVEDDSSLNFSYVEHEISPLRTTGSTRASRRSLDLLLENDGVPVFAELKIRGDRLAYFGLVQILMLTSELVADHQRTRLTEHSDVTFPGEAPYADAWIIAFDPPERGKYRARSEAAVQRIAEQLVADPRCAAIRQIAYIYGSQKDGELTFRKHFAVRSPSAGK